MHCLKESFPINSTESGINISVIELQFKKAPLSIDLAEFGIVTLDNDEHPLKISSLIIFKNEGNGIFCNDVHLKNEPFPIDVTDDGICICSNDVHLQKVPSPIEIREESPSNETSFNFDDLLNALSPIFVIEEGIVFN